MIAKDTARTQTYPDLFEGRLLRKVEIAKNNHKINNWSTTEFSIAGRLYFPEVIY